jgi:UDP-glucose 4-epimerase
MVRSRNFRDRDHPLRPVSAYGVSKLAVESDLEVVRVESGLSSVSLRIGNLCGPGQSRDCMFGAVTEFVSRALSGEPIRIFGDGSVTRDYVFIDDVVSALILAGNSRETGPFNIGTGTVCLFAAAVQSRIGAAAGVLVAQKIIRGAIDTPSPRSAASRRGLRCSRCPGCPRARSITR